MVRPTSLVLLLLLAFPSWVAALALGDIELRSKLSQELDARIPFISVQGADLDSMNVDLADFETFRRAGVDRPAILNSLRFKVVDSEDGAFISVTTRDSVNEPFLNFLLELDWPSGRLVREFTLLLDPPIYGAALSAAGQQVVTRPKAQRQLRASSSESRNVSQSGSPGPGGTFGPVGRTDTLWSIASQMRAQGVTTQQMMLAILKANPQAFAANNVNALRAGSILNIPSADVVAQRTASEAVAEVGRQNTNWKQLRRLLTDAATKTSSTNSPSSSVATAAQAISTAATPGQPIQPEGQVRISGGSSQGAAAGAATSGEVQALESRLDSALEELGQLQGQVEALNDNLGKADALVEEMNRAVQIRDNQLTALQVQLAEAQAALRDAQEQSQPSAPSLEQPSESEQTTAATRSETQSTVNQQAGLKPEPAQTAAVKPEPRAPPPPPPPPPRTAPKEWYEEIVAMASGLPVDPIVLGGAIGAIIVIIILALLVKSRKGKSSKNKTEAASPGLEEVMQNPEVYDARTEQPDDEATQVDSSDGSGTVDEGEVFEAAPTMGARQLTEEDPLQEVNVYLAYEQFGQAEEIVRKAIEAEPDRAEYKLKLLEVQHGARDRKGFMQTMQVLEAAVGADDELMVKAQALLNSLPDSAPTDAGDNGVDLAGGLPAGVAETVDAGLDFDLGFDSGDAGATAVDPGSSVDFDLGLDLGDETTTNASDSELDFTLDAADEVPADFDDANSVLDFTLDAADEPPSELESDGSVDFDFDLELGDDDFAAGQEEGEKEAVAADAGAPEPSEQVGLDTEVLDFDLAFGDEGPDEAGQASGATDEAADSMLGGESVLDFDLETVDGGEEAPSLDAGGTDGGDEDLGLDLDLDLDGLDEEPAVTNTDVGADANFETVQLDVSATGDEPTEDDAEQSASLLGVAVDADESSAPELDIEFDLPLGDDSETIGTASSPEEDDDDGHVRTELMLDVPFSDTEGSSELDPLGKEDLLGSLDLDVDTETLDVPESSETLDIALDDGPNVDASGLDDSALDGSALDSSSIEDDVLDLDLDLDLSEEPQVEDIGAGTGELELPLEELGSDDETIDASAAITQVAGLSSSLDSPDEDFLGIDDPLELPLPPDEQTESSHTQPDEDSEAILDLDEEVAPLDGIEAPVLDSGETDSLDLDLDITALNSIGSETDTMDSAAALGLDDEEMVDVTSLAMDDEASEGTVDFLLDFDEEAGSEDLTNAATQGLGTIDEEEDENETVVLGRPLGGAVDEVQTKLELAQEYLAMGDKEAAGDVLDEVMSEGDDAQKQAAQALRSQIDA